MAQPALDPSKCPPARVVRPFVNARERAFASVLMKAFRGRVTLFLKVRVLDVIQFHDEPVPRRLLFWQDVLGDKRFDYLVCRHKTLEPLMAVDLADPSAPPDTFKMTAARKAKFPLVRIPNDAKLTPETVRERLIADYEASGAGALAEELR